MTPATKEAETTEEGQVSAPGLRYDPDELKFTTWTAHALLYAVVDAIQQRRRLSGGNDADRFVAALKRAAHRLDRAQREAGVDAREDVLLPALRELEQARGIVGREEDASALLTAAGIEIQSTLGDHFYAANELLDWALAGCRARLAELAGDGSAGRNGDGSEPAAEVSDQDLETLGLLLHAGALAADGELAHGDDRTPTEARTLWGRLVDNVKPVYERLLAARGIDADDEMVRGLEAVDETRAAVGELEGDDAGGAPARSDDSPGEGYRRLARRLASLSFQAMHVITVLTPEIDAVEREARALERDIAEAIRDLDLFADNGNPPSEWMDRATEAAHDRIERIQRAGAIEDGA